MNRQVIKQYRSIQKPRQKKKNLSILKYIKYMTVLRMAMINMNKSLETGEGGMRGEEGRGLGGKMYITFYPNN